MLVFYLGKISQTQATQPPHHEKRPPSGPLAPY